MGSFAKEFTELCTKVNGYLQELRANEEAVEALVRIDDRKKTVAKDGTEYDWTPATVTFPGTYSFTTSSISTSSRWIEIVDLAWGGVEADGSWTFESHAQDAVDAVADVLSMHDGGCDYMCPNITAPDLDALSGACVSLSQASADLYRLTDAGNDGSGVDSDGDSIAMPTFVARLQDAWPATSLGSESFYKFYGRLALAGSDYSTATQRLAVTSSSAAGIVQQYRVNLLDIANAALESATGALKTWQENKGPVFVSEYSALIDKEGFKVLDGASTALGLLAKAPVVGTVAAAPQKVIKGAKLVGRLELPAVYEQVASSDELHRNFHASLDDAESQMKKALDHLMTSDEIPVMADGKPADADGDGQPDTAYQPPFEAYVKDKDQSAAWDLPDVEF